jgi:KpsF/GutQ family protein
MIWSKARHVWDTGAKELERLITVIDRQSFINCVKMIGNSKGRIFTAGVGTSGAAAKKISHSLSCIERPSFFLSPGDAVHGALGSVQPGDIGILISKGGGTGEILSLIPSLKSKRAFIIGVTENDSSPLAENSDLLMKIKIEKEADEFNMLATTSTMAVTVVFDAVCIALMEYTGYSKEQFAVIHPSGAVGERLLGDKI